MPESYLGAMLGGAASFLVGFIASPAMELFKARLLGKSLRSERKRELVAKLRMTLGHMDAFGDHIRRAVPHAPSNTIMGPDELAEWKEVQAFSLEAVRQYTGDLTRLELEVSATSGVGQSLVKRILLFCSAAEQVKRLEPARINVYDGVEPSEVAGERPRLRFVEKPALSEEAGAVISNFKSCDLSLRRFIAGPYAQKLGIDSLSLVVDGDIMAWDHAMARYDVDMAFSEVRRNWEDFQKEQQSQK